MSAHPTSPAPDPHAPSPSRHAGQRPAGRLQPPGSFVAGLVAPPVAWALHQQASYLLTSIHCPASATWFHVLTLTLLALASTGAALVWRTTTAELVRPDGTDRTASGLSRFLRTFGLASAALFGAAIVAQGLPVFVFAEPCP